MPKSELLEKSGIQIKLGPYGVASSTALTDLSILPRVQDYRRQSSARMYPLDRADIHRKISAADFFVSRKIDGEFTVLVYQGGQAISINPGGTVRVGLPWLEEAAKLLKKAKIKSALVAGELYIAGIPDRRPRVHDVIRVARQPESAQQLETLAFAVFDLISVNDDVVDSDYDVTWQRLTEIFGRGELVHPVETVMASSPNEIESLFAQWVDQEGAEGLVARSETAGFFKLKPRHTLDAAVIGFTESTDDRQGMLHDLLLAVVRGDGAIQVLGRVGGGFSDDDRREMLSDLKDMVVESEYAEVNSDHVAYQMVQPEWVVEISCLDLISQTTRGAPVNRMVLNWNRGDQRYEVIRRMPLVSVISPQFVRRRDDKQVTPQDVRVQQVADLVDVEMVDRDATGMKLPKSQLMRREVYTKLLKGELMVRKFLLWRTNKENESEEFPAYVIHYTDFSPNRKIPLVRDVRVSNSLQQIEQLWKLLVEENIKKGWELNAQSAAESVLRDHASPAAADPTPTPGKSSAKKTAAGPKSVKTKATKKQPVKKSKTAQPPRKKSVAKKSKPTTASSRKKAATKKATTKKAATKKAATKQGPRQPARKKSAK